MRLKVSPTKWWPFCHSFDVVITENIAKKQRKVKINRVQILWDALAGSFYINIA